MNILSAISETTGINFPLVALVPLVIICALGGTVGIIFLIKKFFIKKEGKENKK